LVRSHGYNAHDHRLLFLGHTTQRVCWSGRSGVMPIRVWLLIGRLRWVGGCYYCVRRCLCPEMVLHQVSRDCGRRGSLGRGCRCSRCTRWRSERRQRLLKYVQIDHIQLDHQVQKSISNGRLGGQDRASLVGARLFQEKEQFQKLLLLRWVTHRLSRALCDAY